MEGWNFEGQIIPTCEHTFEFERGCILLKNTVLGLPSDIQYLCLNTAKDSLCSFSLIVMSCCHSIGGHFRLWQFSDASHFRNWQTSGVRCSWHHKVCLYQFHVLSIINYFMFYNDILVSDEVLLLSPFLADIDIFIISITMYG